MVAQVVKNLAAMQETWVQSLAWEDSWRREQLSTLVFWPGEFHGLLAHGVAKSQTLLSNFHLYRKEEHRKVTEVKVRELVV